MKIITSGNPYIDIDGYASCLAYRELLRLCGEEAKAISTAKLNESIPPSLRNMKIQLDAYEKNIDDEFIVLDLSNPAHFDKIVDKNKIIEIIDHHPGFENYWSDKNTAVLIESIGSIATIIFEKYLNTNLLGRMEPNVAKLLIAAILDNTLDFNAEITNKRDKHAYHQLLEIAGLDEGYAREYFSECQKTIEQDLVRAITMDVKMEKRNYCLPDVFGQLVVWDVEPILKKELVIREALAGINPKWIINIVSLSDKRSYVLVSDDSVGEVVTKLFDAKKISDRKFVLNSVKLRKEIMKKALDAQTK